MARLDCRIDLYHIFYPLCANLWFRHALKHSSASIRSSPKAFFRCNKHFGTAKEPFAFARGYRDEEEANQYQSSSHMQGSRTIENILSIFPPTSSSISSRWKVEETMSQALLCQNLGRQM